MRAVIALLAGAAVALGLTILAPGLPAALRTGLGLASEEHHHDHPPSGTHREDEAPEGVIRMTVAEAESAGIALAEAGPGQVARRIALPGTVAANADRLARVPARVAGIVASLEKRLGDGVAAGEVLAVIESAEIASAKGGYLAALRTTELARLVFEREQRLWQRRISAEQDFLKARTDWQEAQIRLDLARQRLAALGLGAAELEALPRQPIEALRRQEVRAPIAGRVIARPAVLGAAVAAEAEVYSVADLSTVWVELAVPPGDLTFLAEGMTARVGGMVEGRIVFLSPVLDPETRSARAVVEVPNAEGALRPGGFVTAELTAEAQRVAVLVPREAVQEIGGESVVFVRDADGFERREVVLGRSDREGVEVVSGLDPGERYAARGSFLLKAELGKAEAGHEH